MRVWPVVLGVALAAAACTPKSGNDGSPASGGASGTGSGGSTGSGGGPAGTGGAGTGGAAPSPGAGGTSGGTGGSPAGTGGSSAGTGGSPAAGDGGSGPAAETNPSTPPTPGGKALLIVGTIPLVGTDTQFESTLKARGMEVEVVLDKDATPANAADKRVIIFSYSMKSTTFKAEAYTDVPVPIIVTEHFLLPRIKMVVNGQHGFTPSNLTKITVIGDHELAGGFPKGEVTVYMRNQEMFWGVPSAAAIKIAHITGAPEKITYFAYDKGAMMAGAMAPAKRVQFFHATHSPDPVDRNLYLNENGLKLLGATIDWCLR